MGNPLINQANVMLQNLYSQGGQIPNLNLKHGNGQPKPPTPPPPTPSNNILSGNQGANNGIPSLMSFCGHNNTDFQRLLTMLQGGGNLTRARPSASQASNTTNQPHLPGSGLLGDAPPGQKPGLLGSHPTQPNMAIQNPKPGLLGSGPPPANVRFPNGQPPPREATPVSSTGPGHNQAANASQIPSLLSLPFTTIPGGIPQQRPNGMPTTNMNGASAEGFNGLANPLLALAIELQIRQQLNSLQNHNNDTPNRLFTFTGNQNSTNLNLAAQTNKPYAKTPGRKPPSLFGGLIPQAPTTWTKHSDQENIPHHGKQVQLVFNVFTIIIL